MEQNLVHRVEQLINQRKDFRVTFPVPLAAKAFPVLINNRQVGLQKYIKFEVLDLSAGGMKIRTTYRMPVARDIIFKFCFEIMKENFALEGYLIWRKESVRFIEYGVKFLKTTETEKQRLVKSLNLYQITRIKSKAATDPAKTIVDPLMLKLIEFLPYPACLIDSRRTVIAINNVGDEKFGIITGQPCYQSIFNAHRACGHCMLHEALSTDRIITTKIGHIGHNYNLSWLMIQEDLYLHCFIKVNDNAGVDTADSAAE